MAIPIGLERSASGQIRGYAGALLMVGASTLAGLAIAPRWGTGAVDLLYLPAVLGAAVLAGIGPALFAALVSTLAYNFFFTVPHYSLRVASATDLVTVLALFAVAAVTSKLAGSIRDQADIAEGHASRNATIAGLARRLLSCTSEEEIAATTTGELAKIFDCNALLIVNSGQPRIIGAAPAPVQLGPNDLAAAELAMSIGEPTGRGLDRAVPTEWQFHPVSAAGIVLAAVAIARDDGIPPVRGDQLQLLQSLLDQVALALERGRLEGEAREFTRVRERDRIRSVLLSSIGQELAPSLATVARGVRALRRSGAGDKDVVSSIGSETARMERYLSNLTELDHGEEQSPLHAGAVTIDLLHRSVSRDGEAVHLTPKEFAVLAELARHPGRVLTHSHLLRTAWGQAQEHQTEYLRVAVRGLRQKLERDPSSPELIINEPAVGYRLQAGY